MPPSVVIGAVVGALLGWVLSAIFSKGPKTPMEALRGGAESGGTGCVGFILFLGIGAAVGGLVGAVVHGG